MNTPVTPATRTGTHHPLMIGAAVAVILFCLAGTAAIMGWIPSSVGGNAGSRDLSEADRIALASRVRASNAPQQLALAPQQEPLPDERVEQRRALPPAYVAPRPNFVDTPAPAREQVRKPVQLAQAAPARKRCIDCGNIESVRTITTRAEGSGLGAAGGAVLGGLLGNQVGGGTGRQLATVAGAVGGAVVGNQVEGRMKATQSYEIRVRLDDGRVRTIHQQSAPRWGNGERVRIVNGALRSVG